MVKFFYCNKKGQKFLQYITFVRRENKNIYTGLLRMGAERLETKLRLKCSFDIVLNFKQCKYLTLKNQINNLKNTKNEHKIKLGKQN